MQMILPFILILTSTFNFDKAFPIDNDCHEFVDVANTVAENIINDNPILEVLKAYGERNVKKMYNDIKHGIEAKLTCKACKYAISLAKISIYSTRELNYISSEICTLFKFEQKNVCKGLANLFDNEFYFILKNSNLTNDEMCGILIGLKCMSEPCGPNTNWTIELPSISKSELQFNDKQECISENRKEGKESESNGILHLSDLHIDPYYQFGAESHCNEPLCCRSTSSKSIDNKTAGYWGDYWSCDTPHYTLRQLMLDINTTFADQYQYLIWTGDIVAHDVWNTTKSTIITSSRDLSSLIQTYAANGKRVFPVIGNHEGLPADQFAPPEITDPNLSIGWLYTELLSQWSRWIPTEYHETFERFGYYSSNASQNLKVIVLNTNYCARLNFWQLYNPVDPGNQLKWLSDELHAAYTAQQFVYIIGHIPPDNYQCTSSWVRNYLNITETYKGIIRAQFFGHTHLDEFRILYSVADRTKPISVAYLAPSVTPYEQLNPSFRIYKIDNMATVLDSETYYLNLTDANAHPEYKSLNWTKEYTARSAYNMSTLSACEWNSLYENMKSDASIFQTYYNYYHRYSDALSKECTDSCRDTLLDAIPIYAPTTCTSHIA